MTMRVRGVDPACFVGARMTPKVDRLARGILLLSRWIDGEQRSIQRRLAS